jgi:acyl-CoA dehydrogenase
VTSDPVGAPGVRIASGEPLVTQMAMAESAAVGACDSVVDEAIRPHGDLRRVRGVDGGRYADGARLLGIDSGPTEIMNEIIAKQLGV